jgi:hypothetical protein
MLESSEAPVRDWPPASRALPSSTRSGTPLHSGHLVESGKPKCLGAIGFDAGTERQLACGGLPTHLLIGT